MDLSVASSLHGNKITANKDRNHQVPEIRNITEPTLHGCATHHRDHQNIWTTPLERWHGILQNTCRAHAQKDAQIKRYKNNKSPSSAMNQQITATSTLAPEIWASR